MDIKRNGSRSSSEGPRERFTGKVRVEPLFQANAPGRAQGAKVTFEPSARTAWHNHPLGQTPIGRYASGKFLLLGLGSALTFGSRNGQSAPHPHLYEVAYANHGFKETD